MKSVFIKISGDLVGESEVLYVVTIPERVEKKREQFEQYPKIQIVGF